MSVLIKNVKMPISCWDCFLRKDCNEIIIWSKRRPRKCPLIEVPTPHGRLIDAEALQLEAYNRLFDRHADDRDVAFVNFLLGKAPTIIESEDGDP